MSRVVCRRGVCGGARSAPFGADELVAALHHPPTEYVYADAAGGALAAAGGGGGARLCVCARLAPSRPARSAELCVRGAALVLRVAEARAPHDELLLWFSEEALCALRMPFVTPAHVRLPGAEPYACRRCDAAFAEPNPLKLHLFLDCRPFTTHEFWREAATRLREATDPALALAPAALSASGPAELEALAAELGRSRAGHVCVYCGKLYSRRYGLKIHLRTHTGYRPLRCRHCLRAFGDPSNLNKHVRLHARPHAPADAPARTHTCGVCGRALARRRDLERHVRAHAAGSDK